MSDLASSGYLALAKQSAKGTAGSALATGGVLATDVSLGLDTSLEDADAEIGGGRFQRASSAGFGGAKVGGSVEGVMRFSTFLPLLLLSAGFTEPAAPVEQVASSGAWKHSFVLGTGTPTYLTAETSWGRDRAVRRFVDLLVDSLTLSTEADGDTMLAADLIGISEAWQATPAAPTYDALDSRGRWDSSALTLDGIATYKGVSAEVSFANNASDDEYVIGSRLLDDVTFGTLEAMLSATLRLGSNSPSVTDLYRAANYGTKAGTAPGTTEPFATSGAVTFGSGKLIGTSAVERYRAVVTLPQIIVRPFPLDASGDDVIEVDVEARAYGSAITVDVYNGRATAY